MPNKSPEHLTPIVAFGESATPVARPSLVSGSDSGTWREPIYLLGDANSFCLSSANEISGVFKTSGSHDFIQLRGDGTTEARVHD